MGATSPWIDTQPPAQFVPAAGNGSQAMNNSNTVQTWDANISRYLGGAVLLALLMVFGLQWGGFRFVVAASAGRGGGGK